jgi:primosomal replication protein N''
VQGFKMTYLNQSVIRRLSTLLSSLHDQSCQLDAINTQDKSHRLIENNNLFSNHLFSAQSDQLSDYSSEIKKKLIDFSKLYAKNDDCAVKIGLAKASLAHIEQQLSALITAIKSNSVIHKAAKINNDATNNVRKKYFNNINRQNSTHKKLAKTILHSSHQLHKKLTEHHEFERRLIKMISDREKNLQINSNSAVLNNEMLALHQRLGRCRKAIYAIEVDIAKTNKQEKI